MFGFLFEYIRRSKSFRVGTRELPLFSRIYDIEGIPLSEDVKDEELYYMQVTASNGIIAGLLLSYHYGTDTYKGVRLFNLPYDKVSHTLFFGMHNYIEARPEQMVNFTSV